MAALVKSILLRNESVPELLGFRGRIFAIYGILIFANVSAWAYRNPVRKLFYNLTITSVSVLVALLVGGVETLGLIADQFHLHGDFWNAISDLNDNFGALGYGIVALFLASWAISFLVYRFKPYDLNPAAINNHSQKA